MSPARPDPPNGSRPKADDDYDAEIPTEGIAPAAEREGDGLHVRVIGDGLFSSFPLSRTGKVVIGRAPQADVRVQHPSISRQHAVLHLGAAIAIEDLESANGTRIGERKLKKGERVPVQLGEVIDLGEVMIVLQSGAPVQRPRRIWPHGYFEGRLEEECARAERSGSRLCVMRIHTGSDAKELLEILAERLRGPDIMASYGPGEYELLLSELPADGPQAVGKQLLEALANRGSTARVGVAIYPDNGRTAEELVEHACAGVRPKTKTTTKTKTSAPLVDGEMVVGDDAMQRLAKLVDRIAPGLINVLLLGETGVGKEVMAERIHLRSPRAKRELIRINCGALSETLLESELFGHEKGAFTGAQALKPGLLETADGGTVFLDEIGEMPLQLQVKLLRVLEERKVTRVGGLKPRTLDVRFVFATNRDLEAEVARGKFRQDLYYRMNGISLLIPPLRERVGEIEQLARKFIDASCRQLGRADDARPKLQPVALERLESYSWPGNIRELRNVIERAVLLATDDEIGPEHLPIEKMNATVIDPIASPPPAKAAARGADESELWGELASIERKRIADALQRCAGNQTQAARMLKISRGTLLQRIEAYGLPRPRKGAG